MLNTGSSMTFKYIFISFCLVGVAMGFISLISLCMVVLGKADILVLLHTC